MKGLKYMALVAVVLCGCCHFGASAYELTAKRNVDGVDYDFWVYTPDGYKQGSKHKEPLILFLHGSSLCGRNLNAVLRYGPMDAVKRGLSIPAIVLSPQNPGGAWSPRKLSALIDWAEENYGVDSTRVYVIGMSLGGYGTMDFVGTYPEKVAAAMALCGGCGLSDQSGLGKAPLWVLHGTADRAVPLSASKSVVDRLVAAGNDKCLRYDWLPGASHGALARAFYLKDTYDWLFAHSTSDKPRWVERSISIDNDILRLAYGELRELAKLVGEDDGM